LEKQAKNIFEKSKMQRLLKGVYLVMIWQFDCIEGFQEQTLGTRSSKKNLFVIFRKIFVHKKKSFQL